MNWPTSLAPCDHSSLRQLQTMMEEATQRRATWVPPNADYPLFASEHLHIRTKSGAIAPLVFNRAQRFIHDKLEAQRGATGKVRALDSQGQAAGVLDLYRWPVLPPRDQQQGAAGVHPHA